MRDKAPLSSHALARTSLLQVYHSLSLWSSHVAAEKTLVNGLQSPHKENVVQAHRVVQLRENYVDIMKKNFFIFSPDSDLKNAFSLKKVLIMSSVRPLESEHSNC